MSVLRDVRLCDECLLNSSATMWEKMCPSSTHTVLMQAVFDHQTVKLAVVERVSQCDPGPPFWVDNHVMLKPKPHSFSESCVNAVFLSVCNLSQ